MTWALVRIIAENENDHVADEPMAVMMSAPNAEGAVYGCPVGNVS